MAGAGDEDRDASFLVRLDDAELARLVTRPDLPATFERWTHVLAPGGHEPTHPDTWAGALVLVDQGTLEVDCLAGGRRTFVAGNLLVLGWLPIRRLVNRGVVPVRLVAVRRRGERPPAGLLRVLRPPPDSGV